MVSQILRTTLESHQGADGEILCLGEKVSPLQLDYEQSLFPLRDSRGKRTSEHSSNYEASEREIACRVET